MNPLRSLILLSLAAAPAWAVISPDIAAQVHYLDSAVTPEMARAAGGRFPEGELFTYEFLGLALANIAEESGAPEDVEKAVTKGIWLLDRIDDSLAHSPFRQRRQLPARGGICWLGGRNLLVARLVKLSAATVPAQYVDQFHRDSELLHRIFLAEASGIPETVKGMRWPVDPLFALESLRIHDDLYGTHLSERPIARWVQMMRSHLDAATGLMPSLVDVTGRPLDVPRGCALSWSLAVLPRLDARFAAEQWAAYKKHFLGRWFGVPLFREYPTGIERAGDIDSGPMIAGYGMSATAFALAAARANGDVALATELEQFGERVGLSRTDEKGKRYLMGSVPFFDVMALWTKTVPIGP